MNRLPPGVEQGADGLRFRARVGFLQRAGFAVVGGFMLYLMADIVGFTHPHAPWDWSSYLLLPVALMFLGVGGFLIVMAFWHDALDVTVNAQSVTVRRHNLLRRRQEVWPAADVLSTTTLRSRAERNVTESWMVQITIKGDHYIKSDSYPLEATANSLAAAIKAALRPA